MAREVKSYLGQDVDDIRIYGVPRGGIPVAFELCSILRQTWPGKKINVVYTDWQKATIIVDDIIDSGRTKERFYAKPFFALVDKKRDFPLGDWIVFPWERDIVGSTEDIIVRQLEFIGEDPKREGLLETPRRVIKAWEHFFKGYRDDPATILGRTFCKETYDQMVVLKDIDFFSHCEHHMVPFYGKAHIAYIPGERVVGISKLARLVECFSRRLQIQERMTEQIATAIEGHLSPKGVAVFIEGRHFCMTSRGVEKQNSIMVTSSLKGCCLESAARMEFLLLKNGRGF
jgi:GTP cyclohydrolase I